ncbi:hypothetical protein PCS_01476 [Desulfocurvibacter africanus PCS]|uniref:DUF4139 domain-containing protein n=1 Tax=Desulfocurvibacter africanus PCS TaxID=1262666 RepID=M5Q2V3_DESAF|nr:DUF4139 domain-containing protein [Desulfocurvibacter africanus]EMG37728.1 hypothetical protein PCS_01476 [Desulfocurvibacter africanus PCS]
MNRLSRAVVLAAVLATLCLAWIPTALAEVVSVTFYPDAAQVVERVSPSLSREAGNQSRITIELPPQADPQTVSVQVLQGKGQIRDMSWRRVLREDKERVKALQERIESATAQRNGVESRRLSLDAAVGFWRGLSMDESPTPKAATDMASSVAANSERLYKDIFSLARQIEELDRQLAQLKAQLEQARGGSREVWEISLLIAGAVGPNLPIEYAYTLAGSGWSPVYRVNALPDSKRVEVAMDARIWQRSGQDWRNVQVQLATTRPQGPIAPPDLPPWVIQPMPPARPMPAPLMGKAMTREMQAADMAEFAPVMTERATYRVWDMGKLSLQTGPEQRLRIRDYALQAAFTYLVRPSRGENAYLRAHAQSKEALDLPPGEALLMVDGGMLAKADFSYAGTEQTIFFGGDPLVTAEVRLLERQGGENGFIGKSRTYVWRWQVVVRNAKSYAVDVRMEEPKPQPRDERIKLELQFEPKPEVDPDEPWLLVWPLAVPAKSEKSVTWGVRLEAPADLELDVGWR